MNKIKRKHWSLYPPEDIQYGFCPFGLGIYIFNPVTWEVLEYWCDIACATKEEKIRYKIYLEENGWIE